MGLSILSNIASLDAQRHLSRTQRMLQTNMAHLASGMRINNAADDSAGLAVSDKLRAQIRSLAMAERNANDGISVTQVADGALNEVNGLITRMRELAVEAGNGTLDTTQRSFINTEFDQLRNEIDRIANVTNFNGKNLLDGTVSNGVSLQVGINSSSNDTISLSVQATNANGIDVSSTSVSVGTAAAALSALAVLDSAITTIATRRSTIGAIQNRLNVTINNLASARQQLSSADSRIRDVDVASETAELTRNQILSQAGVAVLAQANQLPSAALSLLGR
jgi:flagellin